MHPALGATSLTEFLNDPFEQSRLDDDSMSTLLNQARNGDPHARSELMEQLQKYLAFIARHQVDPKLQAKMGPSDVVQQSMLQAVQNLEKFRGETVDEFRGWLRQILVNEARQMKRNFRADKRNPVLERPLADSRTNGPLPNLVDSLPTPGTHAAADEQSRAINAALEKLSAEDRLIIQWRNWEGLTFDEIANRLGITVSSASKKWYRALISFKEQFGENRD
jgi:RNA polymerase sigma-70 factor (ECF subfamily)